MADLNIPNLNKRSDKYLFKKKLTLRRKSKSKLLGESFFMMFFSLLLIYLNYLIPNKISLFRNFLITSEKSFQLIIDLLFNLYSISLVIFIFISLVLSLILFSGSLYRIIKVFKRKTKKISYK